MLDKLGPDGTMKFFEQLFPELVESNSIGQLNKDSFQSWQSGGNDVLVELDTKPSYNLQGAKDVYVGGPAALFSATIQVLIPSTSATISKDNFLARPSLERMCQIFCTVMMVTEEHLTGRGLLVISM